MTTSPSMYVDETVIEAILEFLACPENIDLKRAVMQVDDNNSFLFDSWLGRVVLTREVYERWEELISSLDEDWSGAYYAVLMRNVQRILNERDTEDE